jgi:hypothetical protein
MPLIAASTFLEALFVCMIVIPLAFLWGAAIIDAIRHHRSGWVLAGWLLAICFLPILGPILYFALRPEPPEDAKKDAEAAYLAHAELERERSQRPIGGTGMFR